MDAAIFGLIVADIIGEPFVLRPPPAPGGLQLLQSISVTSGGNVSNTGLAMARLGMRVAAAGLVGDDVLGLAMIERLRQGGMDTSAIGVNAHAQTSASVVAVEAGGERVFFHTPGVTRLLDASAFRACFETFARCKWVQIGYFGLLPALTGELPKLLSELRAKAPGVKVALDTVNPPAAREWLDPILPHVDLFAPSRTEAAVLTGETEPAKMVAAFRRLMPRGIIGIKLDAQGCYLDDGDRAVFVPAFPVTVVDTTGAGDTWFGGLLTGLCQGMTLERCGRLANRAAADCCTAFGASTGVRGFEDTLARAGL